MGSRNRPVAITAAAGMASGGLVLGFGLLGVPVSSGFGGAMSANATLLSPASAAFSIWSLIYLGLFGFVGWLWFGDHFDRPRIETVNVPAAWSLILNGLWLVVVQFGGASLAALWVSVAVIIALEVSLAVTMIGLAGVAAADPVELVVVDGTFGLYFGWTTVAVAANIAAAARASGLRPAQFSAELVASAAVLVIALVGVIFARNLGGRFSIALAMGWGLGWIAAGRITAEPASVVVGTVAGMAALLVLSAPVAARIGAARLPANQAAD
jgi:hypothetical protein